jgi:hypothetical protein
MALEASVGGKCFRPLLVSAITSGFLALDTHSSVSDVSDGYNNLKAAWESLVEAANHGHPRAFQVAVTVVLEQLKREQPKKKQRKD